MRIWQGETEEGWPSLEGFCFSVEVVGGQVTLREACPSLDVLGSCTSMRLALDLYNKCSKSIRGENMGTPVRIDDRLYAQARSQARAERRTIAGQIEFWALVGRTALDNPDLSIDFVRDLLVARAEGSSLATPFVAEGERVDG